MQVKDAVFRREGTQAAILKHDGTDAAAAIAVTGFGGHRQPILHGDASGIRVLNFNEQLTALDITVQLDPSGRVVQMGNSVQRVFQAVGENRAQLRIRNGEDLRQPGADGQLHLQIGGLIRKGGADQIHRLIVAELLSTLMGEVFVSAEKAGQGALFQTLSAGDTTVF